MDANFDGCLFACIGVHSRFNVGLSREATGFVCLRFLFGGLNRLSWFLLGLYNVGSESDFQNFGETVCGLGQRFRCGSGGILE